MFLDLEFSACAMWHIDVPRMAHLVSQVARLVPRVADLSVASGMTCAWLVNLLSSVIYFQIKIGTEHCRCGIQYFHPMMCLYTWGGHTSPIKGYVITVRVKIKFKKHNTLVVFEEFPFLADQVVQEIRTVYHWTNSSAKNSITCLGLFLSQADRQCQLRDPQFESPSWSRPSHGCLRYSHFPICVIF